MRTTEREQDALVTFTIMVTVAGMSFALWVGATLPWMAGIAVAQFVWSFCRYLRRPQ